MEKTGINTLSQDKASRKYFSNILNVRFWFSNHSILIALLISLILLLLVDDIQLGNLTVNAKSSGSRFAVQNTNSTIYFPFVTKPEEVTAMARSVVSVM